MNGSSFTLWRGREGLWETLIDNCDVKANITAKTLAKRGAVSNVSSNAMQSAIHNTIAGENFWHRLEILLIFLKFKLPPNCICHFHRPQTWQLQLFFFLVYVIWPLLLVLSTSEIKPLDINYQSFALTTNCYHQKMWKLSWQEVVLGAYGNKSHLARSWQNAKQYLAMEVTYKPNQSRELINKGFD